MIAKGSGLWGWLYPGIFGGRNGAAAGTRDGEALGAPSYPAMSPSSNLLLPEIPPEAGPQPGHSGFWHLGKGGLCGEHCLGHRPSPGPASSAFSGPHPWPHVLAWGPSNPDSPCLVPTTNSPRITYPATHLSAWELETPLCAQPCYHPRKVGPSEPSGVCPLPLLPKYLAYSSFLGRENLLL